MAKPKTANLLFEPQDKAFRIIWSEFKFARAFPVRGDFVIVTIPEGTTYLVGQTKSKLKEISKLIICTFCLDAESTMPKGTPFGQEIKTKRKDY